MLIGIPASSSNAFALYCLPLCVTPRIIDAIDPPRRCIPLPDVFPGPPFSSYIKGIFFCATSAGITASPGVRTTGT